MATRIIRPPARLEPRNSWERRVSDAPAEDAEAISYEQLKSVSLFKDVKYERVDLRALPGTIVLRRYWAGEEICVQDDPGFTAFYVLTAEEIAELNLPALPDAPSNEATISVHRVDRAGKKTLTHTVEAGEGELFGEMSCLYRTPRSATVRAERDCYALEFLRNVLDKINTGSFRTRLDEIYRTRFLELPLRNLELFRHLSDAAYAELKDGVELRSFVPGELILDEHDRPDGLYIIRSGFVKIVKNQSALLGTSAIVDWPAFWSAVRGHAKLWAYVLAQDAGLGAERHDTNADAARANQNLLYALNDLLKKKDFAARIGFSFPGAAEEWAQEAQRIAVAKKDDPQRIRAFNRRVLESLLPEWIVPHGIEPPRVIAYRSAPEWAALPDASKADAPLIGEIGLAEDAPRSASCVAYGQSDDRYGGVRMVFISKALYGQVVAAGGASAQARVHDVAAERKAVSAARVNLPAWQDAAGNTQFDDLGLIQGQKLMLIDLDRCTRCDKCVEACVESHTPGWLDWLPIFGNTGPRDRRSRLFLDGPRLQIYENNRLKNYLVPSTCRQCKDPVCLIGCPVGSIHKGDNGQVVIEDWCIGCGRCALNCPYNAIQMHPIGVIPRGAFGWRHRQGEGESIAAATPFRLGREFLQRYQADVPIEFERRFDLADADAAKSKSFLLHIESSATELTATMNGQAIALRRLDAGEAKQKGWMLEATLMVVNEKVPEMFPGEAPPQPILCLGPNELVIRLSSANAKPGDVLLDAGLTGYVPPVVDRSVAGGEVRQEWVMEHAVVCDMCSGQFGQVPACVNACPHDAADRRFVTHDTFLPGGQK